MLPVLPLSPVHKHVFLNVNDLRKENDEIRLKLSKLEDSEKQLRLYEGQASVLKTLKLEELNALEMKLQQMVENTLCCIVCVENPKNVVLQACGHLDLCQSLSRPAPSTPHGEQSNVHAQFRRLLLHVVTIVIILSTKDRRIVVLIDNGIMYIVTPMRGL